MNFEELTTLADLAENAVLAKYPAMTTTLDSPPAIDGYILSLYIMDARAPLQLILGDVAQKALLSTREKYIRIKTTNRERALTGVMYYADWYYRQYPQEYADMQQRLALFAKKMAGDGGAFDQ